MGKLILLGKPASSYDEPRYSQTYKKCNYSNLNAVDNLIRYVTRSRVNETRLNSLIGYGACGAGSDLSAEDLIQRMLCVQNQYGINVRGGRRMHHEVFSLLDGEVIHYGLTDDILLSFARECALCYYSMGYQVVYALHWEPEEHYHIHFVINAVSFINARKFHTSREDAARREFEFNQILFHFQFPESSGVCPICFVWPGRDKN